MICSNPTFLFTSDSDSSSWLQIQKNKKKPTWLCHSMGAWGGKWPHTGDPAALATSPEAVWALISFFGRFEPFLALLGDRPFWCLVVCLAFTANFSFLIIVSQLSLGFRLHLELGNTNTSLPVSRWLRRNEKVNSHSCCLLLNSCSCCVLNSWFSKHQGCSLVGQCLLSSSSGWLAGEVKFNWAAWGEVPASLTCVCVSALGEPGWLLMPSLQNSCFRSSWNMAGNFIWFQSKSPASWSLPTWIILWIQALFRAQGTTWCKRRAKNGVVDFSVRYTLLWCRSQITRAEKYSCFTDFTLHMVHIYCLNSLGMDSTFLEKVCLHWAC